jgi:hypothetical protein
VTVLSGISEQEGADHRQERRVLEDEHGPIVPTGHLTSISSGALPARRLRISIVRSSPWACGDPEIACGIVVRQRSRATVEEACPSRRCDNRANRRCDLSAMCRVPKCTIPSHP